MDDRSLEETTQEKPGPDSFLRKLYRPGPLVFFFIAAFLGLAFIGYSLLQSPTPPPQVIEPPQTAPVTSKVYEEDTSSEMEDQVKQIDLAIIETMRDLKIAMNQLNLLDVEIREKDGHGYHYQVLQLPALSDRKAFLTTLHKRLAARHSEAAIADNSPKEALISIGALPTHRLLLKAIPMQLPVPQEKNGPLLAIVIDDIGENKAVLRGLVNLDFPVTLAVWPNASFTRESVELIVEKKHELIIHFPMEPRQYPRYNPGDDALFVSMSDDAIRKRVALNVSMIPEAIGVNNHMGSRFTEDTEKMQVALKAFRQHGLFFLDSLTTGKSVGRSAAKQTATPFYERDIFIDNVKDVNAIVHQLKKAENVARKQGTAIAIGHPYRETLSALKKWAATRGASVNLVSISKIPAAK
ncbi:divergent polysaccharide deacetylase family protein [uncultured Pseudodesulfovibrio sp.]|uniref:divergent polysaccharide deacetylase family protein n=1 Tax=uncultured Pseudodesulfovibrio sp. TaxID=2035858 RepID=UPI0029C7DC90|nr:divergent polysaccharide deacetylase family protein [uncultured Pseudodesulfovibrio sp.]